MSAYQQRWSETLSAGEAYLAMIEFARTYFRVGGEAEKEIEFFINHVSETPPNFMDPALEIEWFEAIDKVRG